MQGGFADIACAARFIVAGYRLSQAMVLFGMIFLLPNVPLTYVTSFVYSVFSIVLYGLFCSSLSLHLSVSYPLFTISLSRF